jgi:FMN phosphatase YigB (HAD superfamily)
MVAGAIASDDYSRGELMPRINVVAFDLDDTLVRLSPQFIPEYLNHLAQWLERTFPGVSAVSSKILASGQRMMAKTLDDERLEDFFFRDFSEQTGLQREALADSLKAFYRQEFDALSRYAQPVYGAMGVLATLRARGYRIALLTSALFPREAIDCRLRWAGLEDFPFDWRTSMEVVHATKPQPGFYTEAAQALGISPQRWLMVGNDLTEDILPAFQAGMSVYWVRDRVSPSEWQRLPPNTPVGPLARVVSWLKEHDRD